MVRNNLAIFYKNLALNGVKKINFLQNLKKDLRIQILFSKLKLDYWENVNFLFTHWSKHQKLNTKNTTHSESLNTIDY